MTRLGFVCSLFLAVAAAQPQRSDFAQSRREATFPPDIFDTRPVALDPSHFRMVLENDHVKVIRVLLGPREKSIVMEIPAHVMTCVTDQRVRVNYSHTKPAERSQKAGYTVWVERDEYGLENLEDKPVEWILVVPNSGEKSG
jgi:hypothetical protein